MMFTLTPLRQITGLVLLVGLTLYALLGGPYASELVTEIAILGLLAISLDLVAGQAGMISLCHGALFGLGAYGFASTTVLGGFPPSIGMAVGMFLSGMFGTFVGAITARTQGIFFIMTTLAFGQMAYVFIFDTAMLGGDDGMWGIPRLDFSVLGISLSNSKQFALLCLTFLGGGFVLIAHLQQAAFGRTLVGIRENEHRLQALGIEVWHYKAVGFGFSGLLAGLAGCLAAQHTQFVSPELLTWVISGEILIVVILGGIGTLVGPMIGAMMLVLLRHEVSSFTIHWHLVIGLILVLAVIGGGHGLFGIVEKRLSRWRVD